jgi:NAD(P)-dependent dehydrogenase (short-subunit alcohol dehydrogenase family)
LFLVKDKNMKKTIFITGASSGLGKATAKLFHSKGWYVIATMRNPEQEKELIQLENVSLLPLDVTDVEQIDDIVAQAISSHSIDVVFNNAAYGQVGAMEALTQEQIEKQINTNLMGVLWVTKAFIPYFKQKKGGLFISTTSMGGLLAFPLQSIYHAAKFAIEGWSESLAFELGLHNIGIKTIAPGAIITDFIGRSLEITSHPDYKVLEERLFSKADTMMAKASSAEQIAAIVYEAATDGKDQLRYVAGPDANAIYNRRLEIGPEAFIKEIRDQFTSR